MPKIINGEIYAPEIKDVKCKPDQGLYFQGDRIYTYKELLEMKEQMEIAKDKPFTRFEKPDRVNIIDAVSKDNTLMICCDDLESARKLRTELIKSLELLDFYINQVEETGEIRYVR